MCIDTGTWSPRTLPDVVNANPQYIPEDLKVTEPVAQIKSVSMYCPKAIRTDISRFLFTQKYFFK